MTSTSFFSSPLLFAHLLITCVEQCFGHKAHIRWYSVICGVFKWWWRSGGMRDQQSRWARLVCICLLSLCFHSSAPEDLDFLKASHPMVMSSVTSLKSWCRESRMMHYHIPHGWLDCWTQSSNLSWEHLNKFKCWTVMLKVHQVCLFDSTEHHTSISYTCPWGLWK